VCVRPRRAHPVARASRTRPALTRHTRPRRPRTGGPCLCPWPARSRRPPPQVQHKWCRARPIRGHLASAHSHPVRPHIQHVANRGSTTSTAHARRRPPGRCVLRPSAVHLSHETRPSCTPAHKHSRRESRGLTHACATPLEATQRPRCTHQNHRTHDCFPCRVEGTRRPRRVTSACASGGLFAARFVTRARVHARVLRWRAVIALRRLLLALPPSLPPL